MKKGFIASLPAGAGQWLSLYALAAFLVLPYLHAREHARAAPPGLPALRAAAPPDAQFAPSRTAACPVAGCRGERGRVRPECPVCRALAHCTLDLPLPLPVPYRAFHIRPDTAAGRLSPSCGRRPARARSPPSLPA